MIGYFNLDYCRNCNQRKDSGYSAEIIFKNMYVCSIGFDELDCYKMAYEDIMEEIREPFLTKVEE